jgi:integrase
LRLQSATVRTVYGVLRAILNAAVAADLIVRSPCRAVRSPAARRPRIRFLSADELDRLAAATPIEYRPMIYLGGVLGLRWSEVVGLRVGRLNFFRETLEVAEAMAEIAGETMRAEVKSPASRRTLAVPPFLVAMLSEHLKARGLSGADPDALVFVAPQGGPVHGANFRRRVWTPAIKRAGLDGLTFHGLRHTSVGLMIEVGAHIEAIKQRVDIRQSASRPTRTDHCYPRSMRA